MPRENAINKLMKMGKIENGKLYTFSIYNRDEDISGIVIDSKKEWILIKQNPVDFLLDGLKLIRRKYIERSSRGKEEKFIQAVLNAKGFQCEFENTLPLDDAKELFKHLLNKEQTIQFDLDDDSVCYVGKIVEINDNTFTIQCLGTRGHWMERRDYEIESIRTIELETDYLLSLIAFNKTLKNP